MNKDKRNNIQLLGTLNNADESGIIANANQIYDANEDKSTQDVSKEHTERIETLETKENSMQTTLENITKTGEASAASNVTYNHSDSQLDATNVQQAVDEVHKRSNYNDGDSIIDFNTIHFITDNPEFICVAVDANDKILYGIKTDGQPYFGIGCPQQVKDYIDEQINKILGTDDISSTIDSLKEIEAFLKDFTNSDTLKALLDTKANKTDVDNTIAAVNADIADKYKKSNPNDEEGNVIDTNSIKSVINNPEYFKAFVDNTNKLIEAIGLDGVRKFFAGINVQGTLQCITDNPEYIFAIENDGNPYFGYGVSKQINEFVEGVLESAKADINKKINIGNNTYPSDVNEIDEDSDYIRADIDSAHKVIEGYRKDNVKEINLDTEFQHKVTFLARDNDEFTDARIDKNGKLITAIDKNGDFINKGIKLAELYKKTEECTQQVNSYLDNISLLIAALLLIQQGMDIQLITLDNFRSIIISIHKGLYMMVKVIRHLPVNQYRT